MSFYTYLKAVGTGVKGNRDLTQEEMGEAINLILQKKCDTEQAAAFLMLQRVKLESDDELKGTLQACKKYVKTTDIPQSIELGYSLDGKSKQPFLFPLYSNVLKDFFKAHQDIEPFDLVLSGDLLQVATKGVTTKDIAQNLELGDNIHFFDRKEYAVEISDLTQLRNKLYLRTVFNSVERLLNPANSKYAITSAFHKPYGKKYINLFSDNYENMIVIKGNEGACEVFKDFKYWTKKNGEIVENSIKLEDLGIKYTNTYENLSLEDMQKIIKKPNKELMKIVKLNVAILLFTANRVDSIEEAYNMLNKKDCCIVRWLKWLVD